MRSYALTLVAVLAACSSEPTEEERAAAVAEVEAHQTPPAQTLERGAIRYREIEKHELYGAGCSFAPAGGGLAAVALAMPVTGHIIVDGAMLPLAADKGRAELPYLARSKYDGTEHSMELDLDQDAGEEVGAEVSDYPATLTIRNARDQIVYNQSGIAQCGV